MRQGWHPDPENSSKLRWWDGSQWTSATKRASDEPPLLLSPVPGQTAPKTPGERAKDRKRFLIGCGAASLVLIFVVGLSVSGSDSVEEPVRSGVPQSAIAQPFAKAVAPPPKSAAEIEASVAAQSVADESARRREAEAAAQVLDRATYALLTEREFALLSKDPDAISGRKILLYGWVTQADADTGTDRFLAVTGPTQGEWYDYDLKIVVSGDRQQIAPIREGQYVTVYGVVTGSNTFPLQTGGSATIATFDASIIDITG